MPWVESETSVSSTHAKISWMNRESWDAEVFLVRLLLRRTEGERRNDLSLKFKSEKIVPNKSLNYGGEQHSSTQTTPWVILSILKGDIPFTYSPPIPTHLGQQSPGATYSSSPLPQDGTKQSLGEQWTVPLAQKHVVHWELAHSVPCCNRKPRWKKVKQIQRSMRLQLIFSTMSWPTPILKFSSSAKHNQAHLFVTQTSGCGKTIVAGTIEIKQPKDGVVVMLGSVQSQGNAHKIKQYNIAQPIKSKRTYSPRYFHGCRTWIGVPTNAVYSPSPYMPPTEVFNRNPCIIESKMGPYTFKIQNTFPQAESCLPYSPINYSGSALIQEGRRIWPKKKHTASCGVLEDPI